MADANLFLSHKKADADIAAKIHQFVRQSTGGRVGVFNFSDYRTGLRPGSNIRDDLARELQCAEVVALVYSRPDDDWSYCMWECGVALGASDKHAKAILVLQCLAGRKPSIFNGELIVQLWELDSIKSFARRFKEDSLFPSLRGPATELEDQELDSMVAQLHVDLAPMLTQLGNPAKPVPMHPTVHVETSAPDPKTGESKPALTTVQADAWSSRERFGWPETTGTWQMVRERLRNHNEEFVQQLVEPAREYRRTRKLPEPLTASFVTDNNIVYDPLLMSMTSLEDEAVGYDLVFVRRDEDYDGDIPGDIVEMFAARPVERGMEPFNTRIQLLESSSCRLTWYASAEVLVSDMVEFYLAKSVNRYRGRATVTHRFPWDVDMHYYAIEGQASSTGEFIFTYWNLYGGSLLGACALKKTTSGRIYTGDWIGCSGESDANNATMMGGRLRMCTHSKPLEELRRARADLEAEQKVAASADTMSVDQLISRRAQARIDALTEQTFRECEECVRLQGSLIDSP